MAKRETTGRFLPHKEFTNLLDLDDKQLTQAIGRLNDPQETTAKQVIRNLEGEALKIVLNEASRFPSSVRYRWLMTCDRKKFEWVQSSELTDRQRTVIDALERLRACDRYLEQHPDCERLIRQFANAIFWILTEAARPIESLAVAGEMKMQNERSWHTAGNAARRKDVPSADEIDDAKKQAETKFPGQKTKQKQFIAESFKVSLRTVYGWLKEIPKKGSAQ